MSKFRMSTRENEDKLKRKWSFIYGTRLVFKTRVSAYFYLPIKMVMKYYDYFG